MPPRADLDPLDFPYILGNIVLLGVERDTALRPESASACASRAPRSCSASASI
jgi:hypothetical protein